MLMQALALLLILSLVLPLAQLVRVYRQTEEWKYNLPRFIYGDLSGLVILGTTYAGYQAIGT